MRLAIIREPHAFCGEDGRAVADFARSRDGALVAGRRDQGALQLLRARPRLLNLGYCFSKFDIDNDTRELKRVRFVLRITKVTFSMQIYHTFFRHDSE